MPSWKRPVAGQPLAQVDNPDPFTPPVWRSPIYETPYPVIVVVQLARLAWRLVRFAVRHPVLDVGLGVLLLTYRETDRAGLLLLTLAGAGILASAYVRRSRRLSRPPVLDAGLVVLVLGYRWLGWLGPVLLVLVGAGALGLVYLLWPDWFTRHLIQAARDAWRGFFYRRRWTPALTLAGLAPAYRGRVLVPDLVSVRAAGAVDVVTVRLVTGQAPEAFSERAVNLSHAFGARLCRVRELGPGVLVLEFVRADTLADPIAALPNDVFPDLAGLHVGRCEDGSPWILRLLGSHVLIAGATGSGKGSVIWSAVRAMMPAITGGWVQVWALDPKRMELSFGRDLFTRYADTPASMVRLLEHAVSEMHDRASKFAGKTRTFSPSAEFPFLVILVDELAFLTAYQPDRDLKKRAEAAIATLTSQGRSVGVCVIGALQDPRKDVISLRNLFPTRIALRLDESDQVNMVLGDGARDRGALADEISPLPVVGAGVGYVRLEGSPDVIRVRAAYVSDDDIRDMNDEITGGANPSQDGAPWRS